MTTKTPTNLIDITNITDRALEVILASRSGGMADVSHLKPKERTQVGHALGYDKTVSPALFDAWCRG